MATTRAVGRENRSPRVESAAKDIEHQTTENPAFQTRLMTIQETARHLNTTVWFVRNCIWSGKLPFVPMGKRHLIDRADVEKLIVSLKRTEKN